MNLAYVLIFIIQRNYNKHFFLVQVCHRSLMCLEVHTIQVRQYVVGLNLEISKAGRNRHVSRLSTTPAHL